MDQQKILEKAKAYRDYTAQNLSKMIQVPGFSCTEKDRVLLLKKMCEEAGMEDLRIDGLGSLLGRVGKGGKKLVFDAHIDTVGVGDPAQWKLPPHSGIVKDGLVHGRGASDQLGGAASMITAARILKEMAYSGDYEVWFAFTTIEEDCDGLCWKYLIEEEKFVPDFVVSTEPTSCRLYRGHRGRMEIQIEIQGISCHGSAPERGESAAYKAARAALAIEKLNAELEPDDDKFLGKGTITVSQIKVHGPSQCAVPDQAMLYCDRRLTWGEDDKLAISQVEKALKAAGVDKFKVFMPEYSQPAYTGLLYKQELYFPTWKIPNDHFLVRSGVDAYTKLYAAAPVVDKWTFSTNLVAVCGRHKIPSIGFGPGDESQAHAPNEINRVDDLEKCAAFYAALPFAMEARA
ncbi:MAG TPA: YgeY family selenium metabolism-linked hydrolase [Spirochaetia bacterium]|nr:YgeY family selenium metabolism-linked hydrolase [Spirochaetales bacterium]HRY71712.1 YgeY family selenium metabolism-linked hydrolase [Spirochaetia bacterium]